MIEASDFPADCAEELTQHASKTIADDAGRILRSQTTAV